MRRVVQMIKFHLFALFQLIHSSAFFQSTSYIEGWISSKQKIVASILVRPTIMLILCETGNSILFTILVPVDFLTLQQCYMDLIAARTGLTDLHLWICFFLHHLKIK